MREVTVATDLFMEPTLWAGAPALSIPSKAQTPHNAHQQPLARHAVATAVAPPWPTEPALVGFGLVCVFVFWCLRRVIARVLRIVIGAFLALAMGILLLGGAVLVHERFGLLYAAGFVAALLVLGWALGRSGIGEGSTDGDARRYADDADEQDRIRRQQEHQVRETERIRRVHEETRRRNPW